MSSSRRRRYFFAVSACLRRGSTGRFLKDLAALVALAGDDLGDAALPDDRVPIAAEACVHEQLIDVAQAACLAVDIIFALAAPVIAAGDHDLGVFGVEDAGAVV